VQNLLTSVQVCLKLFKIKLVIFFETRCKMAPATFVGSNVKCWPIVYEYFAHKSPSCYLAFFPFPSFPFRHFIAFEESSISSYRYDAEAMFWGLKGVACRKTVALTNVWYSSWRYGLFPLATYSPGQSPEHSCRKKGKSPFWWKWGRPVPDRNQLFL